MSAQPVRPFSRRRFLHGLTLAGTAGLLGLHPRPVAAEPPPETTRLRLVRNSGICVAPEYVAEELLRGEGFTEVQYVKKEGVDKQALASGEVDITLRFRGAFYHASGCGRPDRPAGGSPRRLFRTVRDGAGPGDP